MAPRKKAVELAKKIAKERDGYTCQRCGACKPNVKIDGAHILPETYGLTAANPRNIIALCSSHHTMDKDSWHKNPLGQQWFHDKFPGLYDEMWAIANPTRPIKDWEWKEWLQQLKSTGALDVNASSPILQTR